MEIAELVRHERARDVTSPPRRAAARHRQAERLESILEKPGKLTAMNGKSSATIRTTPSKFLKRIPGFEDLERGCRRASRKARWLRLLARYGGEQLSSVARILAVADIFDALRAKRPYRDSMPLEKVFAMMREDSPRALDVPCLEALIAAANDRRL